MMKRSHSRGGIKPFDILFADCNSTFGGKMKHYYVCIYCQKNDNNTYLANDFYGLLITTNDKYKKIGYNDYNVEININNRICYVCCDKLIRIQNDYTVCKKTYSLNSQEVAQIKDKFNAFILETKRQMNTNKGEIL